MFKITPFSRRYIFKTSIYVHIFFHCYASLPETNFWAIYYKSLLGITALQFRPFWDILGIGLPFGLTLAEVVSAPHFSPDCEGSQWSSAPCLLLAAPAVSDVCDDFTTPPKTNMDTLNDVPWKS